MDVWLTVQEVEQKTRIPERTIRRYLSLHGYHVQTRKNGRSLLVSEQSVPVLLQIRDWYAAGWSAERVEEALAQSGLPVTVTIDGHDTAMTVAEALQQLQQQMVTAMTAMAEEMEKLRREVAATREENERLRSFLEERLQERDQQLMEALRAIQQRKPERKNPWWKFWSK